MLLQVCSVRSPHVLYMHGGCITKMTTPRIGVCIQMNDYGSERSLYHELSVPSPPPLEALNPLFLYEFLFHFIICVCYADTRKAYLGQHVTSGASFNSDKSVRVESD